MECLYRTLNRTSVSLPDKSGFAAEGIQRDAEPHADGWHDLHLHAKINDN